jgi:outer membrane protein assembly factor BamB
MSTRWVVRARPVLIVAGLAVLPAGALAQYAETPRTLGVVDGFSRSAVQIGRRLFVAGLFAHVSPPTGTAVVVDASGAHVPSAFPAFAGGPVNAIVPDGLGGWVVAGGFTSAAGRPQAAFARVRPDRTIDPRYRVTADGPIRRVAIAHGRVYLVGDFSTINGAGRRGLAALEAATGLLTPFAADFDPGRTLSALSISSIGVYVSGWIGPETSGRLWGFDAATGQQLFERQAWVNAIAATSQRVYVGGFGYRRPVWAVDPLTGQDVAWSAGLAFEPVSGTYGDYTAVGALLLDEGRLYLAGRLSGTRYSRPNLAAVIADTGQPVSWHAEGNARVGSGLVRIGPALVVTGEGVRAFAVATGLAQEWYPRAFGGINTVAPAPEGAVIGGSFNGIGGVERSRLAAFDLDSGAVDPWTAALPTSVEFDRLDTDGTWLFGITHRGAVYKIDPTTGAVIATLDFGNDVYLFRHRVAGGRIVVAIARSGGHELAVITIADWSRQVLPVTFAGPLSNDTFGIEVTGDTAYVAGTFTMVNGADRPYFAAVNLDTGAVLPFAPSPDAFVRSVTLWNGALVAGGPFRRIGGVRRRGLAALDPVTGQALDWNPDAVGGAEAAVGPDGVLYTLPQTAISGRSLPLLLNTLVAFSPSTGRLLPWRAALGEHYLLMDRLSFSADCLVAAGASEVTCHPPAPPSPTAPLVHQQGSRVTMQWTLPGEAPTWTGVRVEAGRREGASDLGTFALPPDATALGDVVAAGTYFARVRTIGPGVPSLATEDVSFAVGAPPPPLDATVVTEGTRVTFAWRPPSTGNPAGAYLIEAGTAEGSADLGQRLAAGTSTTFDVPPGRYWARVRSLLDGQVSAPSGELFVDVDSPTGQCSGPPAAPAMLSASIGLAVELRWQQPDRGSVANLQRIVAGSAPSLADLAVFEVPGPAVSFTTALPPRGTYYVRAQGLNSCGAGSFSNEVQVIVR